MTREQRLERIKEGKTILRARRQPKSGKWEIVTYTGSSFMVYSFDKFDSRTECEGFIDQKVLADPRMFVSDFSNPELSPYERLKKQHSDLLKQLERLTDRLEWVDGFIHNAAANNNNQAYINETRELIQSISGKEAVTA